MPQCHCQTYKCNGRAVDSRTFNRHSNADQAEQARAAREVSKTILEAQDDDISTYFATMTLAGRVSGSTPSQGSRLWSRASADPDDAVVLAEIISPGTSKQSRPANTATQRHRTEHSLRRIMDIEQSFSALQGEAVEKLARLGTPESNNSPFPLKTLISATHDLRDQLNNIKSQFPAIVKSRTSVSEQVEELYLKLKASQRSWVESAQKLPKASSADQKGADNEVNTGKFIFPCPHFQLH